MHHAQLVREYLDGPFLVRDAVAGMTPEQLCAKPILGQWSTLEVVCHLADAEMLYAERMKRVIVEDEPTFGRAEPDACVARLACQHRNLEVELRLIELTRCQMAHILRHLEPDDYQRCGIHSADGRLTLKELLRRVIDHIPHHVRCIGEKRQAFKDAAWKTQPAAVLEGIDGFD
jgi:hypothetical protein